MDVSGTEAFCTKLLTLDRGTIREHRPEPGARHSGHVRVPPELLDRARQTLGRVVGLTVAPGDRPDVLTLTVAADTQSVDAGPYMNTVFEALLRAEVPVLSFRIDSSPD